MLILFQPACFSSSGSNHFNFCEINSKFSHRCLFHPSQVVFLFAHPPTFFFKDSYMLIKYPCIHVKSIHSFQSMFLPGDYHEVGQEFQVHHPSFFFFSGGSISSFQCWSYSFPRVTCFFIPVHLLIFHFSLFICSGVLKISQKTRVSILNPFKLFGNYYLIQVI